MFFPLDTYPQAVNTLVAEIFHINEGVLNIGDAVIILEGVNSRHATITHIEYRHILADNTQEPSDAILCNNAYTIQLSLQQSLRVDTFEQNKFNGCFILVNPITLQTISVGFVRKAQ